MEFSPNTCFKGILNYSNLKGLDLVNFYEISLFSYLVGNSDMHLKNFSLIENDTGYSLAPAYDLLAVKIAMPKDLEEMALTLNGKKNKLKKKDFLEFAEFIKIPEKTIENTFSKFKKKKVSIIKLINSSLLSSEYKKDYSNLIEKRFKILD